MSLIKSGLSAAVVLGLVSMPVALATSGPAAARGHLYHVNKARHHHNEAHHYHKMYHHHGQYHHRQGVTPHENKQTRTGGQPGGGAGGS